jgi:hypothetical protein
LPFGSNGGDASTCPRLTAEAAEFAEISCPALSAGSAVRRTAGSSTSTCFRGGSFANTPTPACDGSGQGAFDHRPRFGFHDRFGLALEALDVVGFDNAFGLQARNVQRDRIARGPVRVELAVRVTLVRQRWNVPRRLGIAAEVEHVVVVGVATETHGDELDQRWSEAGAGPFGGPAKRAGNRLRIGPVERQTRHAVAGGLVGEYADRRLIADGRRQRRLIVLHAEDHRQTARGAEVDSPRAIRPATTHLRR